MKLYTTGQGHWAGTQADARKVKKDQGLFCVLYDVPVSKQELLTFLILIGLQQKRRRLEVLLLV